MRTLRTHKAKSEQGRVPTADEPLRLEELKHSQDEPRFHALGITDDGRLLHVTFTLRAQNTLIRIISARDMHGKERNAYEQAQINS